MAQITDIPTAVTGAGQPFNYTNPPTLATVALVNAPLDPDHNNIGLNRAAYDTYIDAEIAAGRAYTATGINLQNPAHPLVLPIPFESSPYFYNYGRVNIGGVNWYIFYDAEYMNKTSTRFIADIDEAASYNWLLGYSPIERGHVAVAAAQSDPYGDLYMTAPEPIDAPPMLATLSAPVLPASNAPASWRVVVACANDLRGSGATPYFQHHVLESTVAGAASVAGDSSVKSNGTTAAPRIGDSNYPWHVGSGTTMQVFVPNVTASPVSTIDGVAVGGGVYLFSLTGFAAYMSIMQGAPWVLDGISEINIIPDWAVSGAGGGGSHTGSTTPPTDPTSGLWASAAAMPTFVSELNTQTTTDTVLTGWRGSAASALALGPYTKALTSQFARIVVSDGSGAREYMPEVWKTSGVGFTFVSESTHGNPLTHAIPLGYTALGDQETFTFERGGTPSSTAAGFGSAAANTSQQDIGPAVNAQHSFVNRSVTSQQQTLATTLAITKAQITLGTSAAQTVLGAAQGGASGGLAGAAASGVSGLASFGSTAVQSLGSLSMLDVSNNTSVDIIAYQLWNTNNLNYYGFQAWAQSLNAVSGHGSAHNLAGAWRTIIGRGLTVLIKTPTTDAVNRALSMWKQYGYMVGRSFKPSRLDVMSQMSYWKTNGAVITGALPQTNRRTMAQAFDRGLTVWSLIAAIGTDVTATNAPTAGISY